MNYISRKKIQNSVHWHYAIYSPSTISHTYSHTIRTKNTTEDNDMVVIPPPAKTLTIDEKVMF